MGGCRQRINLRAGAAVAALAVGLTPYSAAAQSPAPPAGSAATAALPSREELNPAGRAPAPRAADRDLFAPEPPGPCPLAGSDLQVTLNSVSFRGLTAVQPGAMAPAYQGLTGRPVPVQTLCEIRDRAARILFDTGVLARVEIPEQRIAGGALVLEVIEAQIVNVRVRGDAGPAQATLEAYVEKLRGMKPFDMRKAQRYLLLASDIPGLRVRATVRPSTSGERGAVDIDVQASRDPFGAVANVQNLGSKAIGRWGALARANFDSFTRFGERTSLIGFHTLDSNEQWVVQGLEEARFGSEGLVGRLSLAYGETRPGDVLEPLGLKSRSFVGGMEAAYPLVRMRAQNLNLAGGLDWVDQTTDVGRAGRLNSDSLRVFYVRADGDLRREISSVPLTMAGSLSLRKGVSALGASQAGGIFRTRLGGQPDAWVVRASGSAYAGLGGGLGVGARVNAQFSEKPLLAYEQITLGNLTAPRGYDPAVIAGDKGVTGAIELRYDAFAISHEIALSPYAFYELGYLRNNDAGLDPNILARRTLRSVGAGVSIRLNGRASLDVACASPIDSPAPGARPRGARVLVSLTTQLQ